MAISICQYVSYVLIIFSALELATCTESIAHKLSAERTISLADYNISNADGQAFHVQTIFEPNNRSIIIIDDIPDIVSFIIIQIHVHEKNITLSYDDSVNFERTKRSLSGSNLGLMLDVVGNTTARAVVNNEENTMVNALIAVVAYTDKTPIPGGCNLEFDIEISPFQKVRLTDATVIVEAQPASAPKVNDSIPSCDKHPVKLTAYRMYLPERDFTSETYFAGVLKMMTVPDIIKNGQLVGQRADFICDAIQEKGPTRKNGNFSRRAIKEIQTNARTEDALILSAVSGSSVRRSFSAYPGTGSVYAMIATHGNYSSAYVPAATYACNPVTNLPSCGNLNTTVAQALCAIVLVVGIIMTFFGHKCLGFEVVFLGAICGGIISFAILTAVGYFETPTVLGIVITVSFLSGIGWLILSVCMGKPHIATFLASATLGFFIASTVYFGIADDTPLFESDMTFWLIYTGVTLLVPLILAILPFSSNIVSCAILGAYSIIIPIDYYLGSNLKYIVINTIRRATISGFNVAVIQPPYQATDKWLIAFLVLLAIFGIYVQVCQRSSCFRCCRSSGRTTIDWDEDTREPILSATRNRRRVLVLGENHRVQRNW